MRACDRKTKATLRSALARASELGGRGDKKRNAHCLLFHTLSFGSGHALADRNSERSDLEGPLLPFPELYFWEQCERRLFLLLGIFSFFCRNTNFFKTPLASQVTSVAFSYAYFWLLAQITTLFKKKILLSIVESSPLCLCLISCFRFKARLQELLYLTL